MSHLTAETLRFLAELEENNNRDWFQANKKRYETHVKVPFQRLVDDLIDRLSAIDPAMLTTSREAIFRINRDIRFSADKSPYKTHLGAVISTQGKNAPLIDGLYLQVGAHECFMAAGVYMPDPKQILAIREAMAADPARVCGLLEDPAFSTAFGKIEGEKNKVIAKELKAAAEQQPLIYNKQFFYTHYFKDVSVVLEADFAERLIKLCHIAGPWNDFLREALTR